MKKHLTSSAMILALTAAGVAIPMNKAVAGSNAGAAIIGALIGGAIVAGATNNNRRTTSTASSAQRTENRAVQTALNYFEFPAGTPDGVFGRRTRTAVSNFQAYMDFPISGELTSYQKEFLLNSHQRAELGGAETSRIILTDPNGSRALLISFMQQQQGGNSGLGLGNSTMASSPANDFNGGGSSAQTSSTGLPVFVTSQESSMNELCISGIQPNSVEAQFCNLRAYAIDEGDALASSVQGTTRADIQAQCIAFAPTLNPYVSTVSLADAGAAKTELQSWVSTSGASAASLEGIAKVCLGIGYSTDNSDVALASIMTLVGLGQSGYEELLAYHLALGFGFDGKVNTNRGAQWLDNASLAFASGQESLTGESGAMRATVAVSLANSMRGLPTTAPATAGIVPAFGVTPEAPAETGGGFFSTGASN
ncbi:MAG: hypothetical protein GQ535_06885 [Rhodobacteraceae bacterium]|nr:hypothetical protein [Paracoccaceae bacterium]